MATFLAGGTGTPKILAGADREAATVVCNTGDDVELGGLLVCPDIDTVLFEGGGVLDRETWWGIESDTARTHDYLRELAAAAGLEADPHYLDDERQTAGRRLARWRRFSGLGGFMYIGDRDRAVHLLRTGLLEEGHTLTEVTRRLADAFDVAADVVPMSDDPVASIVHTPEGAMHFQEFWVARDGKPAVEDVEFRGADRAAASDTALAAIRDGTVIVGPSNPVTSIGPMLALDGVEAALDAATVVAVSPFVGDEAFSGPAPKLMRATGYEASTRGVAAAYPFVDAFVLDSEDETLLDRPTVRTDTRIEDDDDATRVMAAVEDALVVVA